MTGDSIRHPKTWTAKFNSNPSHFHGHPPGPLCLVVSGPTPQPPDVAEGQRVWMDNHHAPWPRLPIFLGLLITCDFCPPPTLAWKWSSVALRLDPVARITDQGCGKISASDVHLFFAFFCHFPECHSIVLAEKDHDRHGPSLCDEFLVANTRDRRLGLLPQARCEGGYSNVNTEVKWTCSGLVASRLPTKLVRATWSQDASSWFRGTIVEMITIFRIQK